MVQYVFRDVPLPFKNSKKADAQRLGEAYEKAGRDPEVIHDAAARDRRHPFRQHLEWDDAVVAKAYRIERIEGIVRLITIVGEDGEPEPRGFISLVDNHRRARYTPGEIRSSADLQMATLRAARRDLKAFKERYRVLADVCSELQAAEEAIDRKLAAAEDGAATPTASRSKQTRREAREPAPAAPA